MPSNKPTGIYFLQAATAEVPGAGVLVGFHQYLFGPDCMCSACLEAHNGGADWSLTEPGHPSAFDMWCLAGCGECYSLSCPRAVDHRYTCIGDQQETQHV